MRLRSLPVLVLLPFLLMACGKYNDAIEVNTKFVNAMESYAQGLDGAKSADDVAQCINKFADEMEKLGPKIKAVNEKYPELQSQEMPEELKELEQRTMALQMQISGAMMKSMRYIMDSDVQAAQLRLQSVMMQING